MAKPDEVLYYGLNKSSFCFKKSHSEGMPSISKVRPEFIKKDRERKFSVFLCYSIFGMVEKPF